MARDPRARARALIQLAVGETTPIEEAKNAALQACRIIAREDLLIESTPEWGPQREELVILRVPMAIVLETREIYRMAAIEVPKSYSQRIMTIPKRFVRDLEMMTPKEATAIGWGKATNITRSITLEKSYFETAHQHGWQHGR